MTYRIRQVAQMFVLECNTGKGWHIVTNLYSWESAEAAAFMYKCEII